MAARGHDVVVITWRTSQESLMRETVNGVRIIRVKSGRYTFPVVGLAIAIRQARRSDVIHTATFGAAPLAWVASRFARIPVIITVPETWIGRWRIYTDYGPIKARIHDVLERLIFTFPYDHYIGISHSTTSRLRAILRRRRRYLDTIYCGFESSPWKCNCTGVAPRLAYGVAEDAFLIVAWGRPGASKGFGFLVDAFPIIHASVPNARLLLILNNAREYRHATDALKRRAHRSIIFVSSLAFDDLVAIVRNSNCAVIPSLAEGFGYTTLEAVSSDVPVAASDSTSIPEVIGGSHRLFEPGNPDALAAAVVAITRGDYVTTPTKEFRWSDTIEAYEGTYRATLDRGKKKKLLM